MSSKITKGEWGKIANWAIVGVLIWLMGAGIRDWFQQTFGDSWLLVLIGVIGLIIYAYFEDLAKFNFINTKKRIR